jgi:hypothetical protein
LTEISIQHLLQLAGVSPSDGAAASWLSEAIEGARASYKVAEQRPHSADHNELLADIEKSAKELTKRVERLRRHPFSWRAFWRSRAFGPVYGNRIEVDAVLDALQTVVRAADMARDPRQGRRPEVGKQHVVDLALAFFVRFSRHRASGTATGAFARFARAFYAAVIEGEPERYSGLDRQIRQAATRLPVEPQRARRKSGKKPRVPS